MRGAAPNSLALVLDANRWHRQPRIGRGIDQQEQIAPLLLGVVHRVLQRLDAVSDLGVQFIKRFGHLSLHVANLGHRHLSAPRAGGGVRSIVLDAVQSRAASYVAFTIVVFTAARLAAPLCLDHPLFFTRARLQIQCASPFQPTPHTKLSAIMPLSSKSWPRSFSAWVQIWRMLSRGELLFGEMER
jgi:hypothetical protein